MLRSGATSSRVVRTTAACLIPVILAGCAEAERARPELKIQAEQQKVPDSSLGDAARLVQYRAAVDEQLECLRRMGYEVSAEQTDEHTLQVAAVVPAEVAPEDQQAFDEWSLRYDQHRDDCGADANVADAETDYLSTIWVDGADREALWESFLTCITDAALPAPDRGLTEEQINDVLLSAGDDETTMQSILHCRALSAGLWPSLTRRGDTKTTVVIA